MLPFTAEVFFANFESYNRAIWPAQLVAYGLALLIILLAARPLRGSGRLIGALLAAAWAWNGVVYHLLHSATINFLAPVFGAFFIIQALLLLWTATIRGKVSFRWRADPCGLAGLGLIAFALLLYPLLGWLAGHGWPQAALFGVAPCPTTVFTLGLLLAIEGRTPLHLVAIPVIWSLIGGSAAWLLGVPEDLVLPIAGFGALALILWKNRRTARS
ncbi:MAG: DUF6064 family protein [Kiloniellales bacterium]